MNFFILFAILAPNDLLTNIFNQIAIQESKECIRHIQKDCKITTQIESCHITEHNYWNGSYWKHEIISVCKESYLPSCSGFSPKHIWIAPPESQERGICAKPPENKSYKSDSPYCHPKVPELECSVVGSIYPTFGLRCFKNPDSDCKEFLKKLIKSIGN